MLLSDRDIRQLILSGQLGIWPSPGDIQFQSASVDLTLGQNITISPGEFMLTHTQERVELPDFVAARVDGRSTWGRRGLIIHATAGFIDPGFFGQITLELHNISGQVLYVDQGERICQLSFEKLSSPCLRPYGHSDLGSKYQGQMGTTYPR